ncbi:MAG: TRAP transporter substrate-binding protein [Pigmentiphaga sp.]|nr:TRAP transporter substrate-binding protein [Pigmentiphaga sp.]
MFATQLPRLATRLAATAALALGLYAGTAQAQTIRYSNWLPITHPLLTNVIQPWATEVEEATQGRVKVETLPKVVGAVPAQFDVVRDGMADLAFVIHGYTPGRFRAHEILELPFLGDDAEALAVASWRLHQEHLAALNEHEGTVPLAIFTQGPGALFSIPGPIQSIDDLRGLKIRVGSPSQIPMMDAVRAVSVQRPVSQLYEIMSTGVVDAALLSREAVKNFNVGRAIKHGLQIPGGFSNLGMSIVINERTWNRLSAEDRQAIMALSGEALSRRMGAEFEAMDRAGLEDVEAHGGMLSVADDDFVADLRQAFAVADSAWIQKAQAAGLADPEAVLADFRGKIVELQTP